jgi:hypothetical protein
MSDIPAAGQARADANGRQKQSGPVLVEPDGKASLEVVSRRSTDQAFERGFGGRGSEHPRRSIDEGGVETDLGRSRLHFGQRQPG